MTPLLTHDDLRETATEIKTVKESVSVVPTTVAVAVDVKNIESELESTSGNAVGEVMAVAVTVRAETRKSETANATRNHGSPCVGMPAPVKKCDVETGVTEITLQWTLMVGRRLAMN